MLKAQPSTRSSLMDIGFRMVSVYIGFRPLSDFLRTQASGLHLGTQVTGPPSRSQCQASDHGTRMQAHLSRPRLQTHSCGPRHKPAHQPTQAPGQPTQIFQQQAHLRTPTSQPVQNLWIGWLMEAFFCQSQAVRLEEVPIPPDAQTLMQGHKYHE